MTESPFSYFPDRNIIQIIFMVPPFLESGMEQTTRRPETAYRFDQVLLAALTVIAATVGAVFLISAPVVIASLFVGVGIGFYGPRLPNRTLHARPKPTPVGSKSTLKP